MRSFQSSLSAIALLTALFFVTSYSATSGENRKSTVADSRQSTSQSCAPSANQPALPTQTCCQPAAASVQPQIELLAYTRPASPRRLSPQPDALEIRRTAVDQACAQFEIEDLGFVKVYQALLCSDLSVVQIFGNDLGPLPGDCANPNGACVEFGGGPIGKSVRLAQKRKPGQESRVQADASATGPHKLKERTRLGQPIYVQFPAHDGSSKNNVVLELHRYAIRGTGKASQELSGTAAFGVEVEAAPDGRSANEFDRKRVEVLADHVARLTIGNVTYNVVTATKLVP